MAEVMVAKKPVKRVAKAGPNVQGGKFKGKDSINLSKKELGKKGTAAASKRTVDIGKTEHMKEGPNKGKVVGPKGNPLTGKVDMGGGNMAVYKDGKRVTAKAKKTTPPKETPPKKTPPDGNKKTLTAAEAKKLGAEGPKTGLKRKAAPTAAEKARDLDTKNRKTVSSRPTFTNGGKTYRWNGKVWEQVSNVKAPVKNDKSMRPGAKEKPKIGTYMKNGGQTFRYTSKGWIKVLQGKGQK